MFTKYLYNRIHLFYQADKEPSPPSNPEAIADDNDHMPKFPGFTKGGHRNILQQFPGMILKSEDTNIRGTIRITADYQGVIKAYDVSISDLISNAKNRNFTGDKVIGDFASIRRDNTGELAKKNRLDEAGEKASYAITNLLSDPNKIETFIKDRNTYLAISEGWLSPRLENTLIERFKKEVVVPLYRAKGWTIDPDNLSITFNSPMTINFHNGMKLFAKSSQLPLIATGRLKDGSEKSLPVGAAGYRYEPLTPDQINDSLK